MTWHTHLRHHRAAAAACAVGGMVILTACGSSGSAGGSAPTPSASALAVAGSSPASTSDTSSVAASGAVNVLYAGSLVDLMEKQLGPAFDKSTGASFTGFSGGSTALATEIKGKVHRGDVFISASPTVNASLEGVSNGNWVSWYATFAESPLVIGYNPKSSYAGDLTSKPWYDVITEKGFRLGSTDPATDPKGKLAVTALTSEAATQHSAALQALSESTSGIAPEETLVGRLQSGQLDAGFFYASEAKAAGIPTVPLTGQNLKATYTVTVLNMAPNASGAAGFISYLLSPAGKAVLTADGFTVASPLTVTGTRVPPSLQALFAK